MSLSAHVDRDSFAARAHGAALAATTKSDQTRAAYLGDLGYWLEFCAEYAIDPREPGEDGVTAWIEAMKLRGEAPKTRARRISSLCSIYKRLRRRGKNDAPPVVTANYFTTEQGPEREEVQAIEPTPLAETDVVQKIVATCDESILGKRDEAMIRLLWATGARRASLIAMTFERIRVEGDEYTWRMIGKGNKENRALIRGKAAVALSRWLAVLKESELAKGPVWRTKKGPMTVRALNHMLHRRAKLAGVGVVSPHMFRVAFLTLNPAGLEAKQSAAGHASPLTTAQYDRANWRGKEAFELMPEIEDAG